MTARRSFFSARMSSTRSSPVIGISQCGTGNALSHKYFECEFRRRQRLPAAHATHPFAVLASRVRLPGQPFAGEKESGEEEAVQFWDGHFEGRPFSRGGIA